MPAALASYMGHAQSNQLKVQAANVMTGATLAPARSSESSG